MLLYVVRHAIAFDHDPARWPDDRERPLTREGEKKFRKVAAGLRAQVSDVDAVLSSPLVRAWQTAAILREKSHWPEPRRFSALEPGHQPADVVAALQPFASSASLALVGHEPSLSELISYLVAGVSAHANLEMKKGGVACLSFEAEVAAGNGTLLWLLTPKLLRALD